MLPQKLPGGCWPRNGSRARQAGSQPTALNACGRLASNLDEPTAFDDWQTSQAI